MASFLCVVFCSSAQILPEVVSKDAQQMPQKVCIAYLPTDAWRRYVLPMSLSARSSARWGVYEPPSLRHHATTPPRYQRLMLGRETRLPATGTPVGGGRVAGKVGTPSLLRHSLCQTSRPLWRGSFRDLARLARHSSTSPRRPALDYRFPRRRRRFPRCRGRWRPAIDALFRPGPGRTGSPPRSRARPGGHRALHRPSQRQRSSSFDPVSSGSGQHNGRSPAGRSMYLRQNMGNR